MFKTEDPVFIATWVIGALIITFMFDSFGLDISDSSMKYMHIKRGMFGVVIQSFGEIHIPDGVIVNGEITDKKQFASVLNDFIKTKHQLPRFAVVNLPESKTFMKLLNVEITDDNPLGSAVTKELANHVPIPTDQLVIDWSPIDKALGSKKASKKNKSADTNTASAHQRVLVAACESHVVHDYSEALREAGITPIAFEPEAQATARCVLSQSDVSRELHEATVVIDWGESQASIIFFSAGTLVFSASSEISGREVTKKIAEKLSMDIPQAEQAKRICGLNPKKCKGVVRQYLQEYIGLLANEVKKGYEFYTSHLATDAVIRSIVLVGGGSNLKDLDIELESILSVGVRPTFGNIYRNLPDIKNPNILSTDVRVSYATALGLAMRSSQ